MNADQLFNAVQNDRQAYESVRFAISHIRRAVDLMAKTTAQANAEWHDDPEADDYAAFHGNEWEQFPRERRDECIRDLVSHYLGEMAIADKRS